MWGSGEAGEAPRFLVLDSSRDAGIHTSDETLTSEGVIAAVATDPRIQSDEDRCEIYAGFVQWSAAMEPEEYQNVAGEICKAYPLEARTPAG